MKIRAAVLHAMGATAPFAESKPLMIEEVELAPPGPGEVLVRIKRGRPVPLRPVGDQRRPAAAAADGARPRGRRRSSRSSAPASPTWRSATMSCWSSCRAAATARRAPKAGRRCASRARRPTAPARCSPGARRLSQRGGTPINHHLGCSAFAEYATVSRRSVVKIDPTLPLDEAALFGCAVLTGVGAVVNTAQVRAGASRGRDRAGRRRAGRADRGAGRRRAADHRGRPVGRQAASRRCELGATHTVNAAPGRCRRPDPRAELRRRRLRLRVRRLDPGARAGLPDHAPRRHDRHRRAAAADAMLPLPAVSLVAEERTLKGSYIGTCVPSRDIPRYIELYRRGACRSTSC